MLRDHDPASRPARPMAPEGREREIMSFHWLHPRRKVRAAGMTVRVWIGGLLGLILMVGVSLGWAQVIEVRTAPHIADVFARHLGGWRLTGPVHVLLPAELALYAPGRGDVVREYGLHEAAFADYTDAQKATIRVEIFHMINYVSAYGIYSLERTSAVRAEGIGSEASIGDRELGFWKGNYYVRLSLTTLSPPNIAISKMTDLARAISGRLVVGPHDVPLLVQHLPTDRRIAGSERFISGPRGLARFPIYDNPNDLFNLGSDGVEAAIAEYRTGKGIAHLLLVEYHTPQLASAAYERVSQYFARLPEQERDRRIFKREGNYLIEAFNVADREVMEALVNSIKYTAKVRWLDRDRLRLVGALPEFPAATWLITTFAFIGVVVLILIAGGVALGYAFFVIRRRHIQRYGFSDAGGMLRLNLDHLILPPADQPRKSLPAGE